MTEEYLVDFPEGKWISATLLEEALLRVWSNIRTPFLKDTGIIFFFPPTCKVMVDAAVRLLSLANQLAAMEVPVTLSFAGEQHEAMNYLNRTFFFSLLSERVCVVPERPDPASAERYYGQSSKLIEFKALHPKHNDAIWAVPPQLAGALETAVVGQTFGQTPFTLFSELINNVYAHSRTELDGFAALQVYRQQVLVVVSDSGVGLLETLKPKLLSLKVRPLEETELLRQLFYKELAWQDSGNGQGLQECARRSLKHRGSIDIRLTTSRIVFNPSPSYTRYDQANAHYSRNLMPLKGTHVCISFPLDRS